MNQTRSDEGEKDEDQASGWRPPIASGPPGTRGWGGGLVGLVVHPGRVAVGRRHVKPGRGDRRMSGQALGGRREGGEAFERGAQAVWSAGPGIDRAPRDALEVAGRGRTPRRWPGTRRGPVADPASGSSGVRHRRRRVTRGPRAPAPRTAAADHHRTSEDRESSRSATASAPAAWSGSTWVSAMASIAPPRDGRDLERAVERRTSRIARVHEHEPAATDEVRADRLTGHAATRRHHDPCDLGRELLDADLAEPARRQAGPDLLDRADELELLECRARRDPHRQLAVGHRAQPARRRQPGVTGDLVSLERDVCAGRQLGDEEARVEAARQGRWRHPSRERRQEVGPQRQVKVQGDLGEARVAAHQRGPRLRDRSGREATIASLGQKHAGLLEQLADRGYMEADRHRRLEITAERRGCDGHRSPLARPVRAPSRRGRGDLRERRACPPRTPSTTVAA